MPRARFENDLLDLKAVALERPGDARVERRIGRRQSSNAIGVEFSNVLLPPRDVVLGTERIPRRVPCGETLAGAAVDMVLQLGPGDVVFNVELFEFLKGKHESYL